MDMGLGARIRKVAAGTFLSAGALLWPGPGLFAAQEAQARPSAASALTADASALKRSIRRTPHPEGSRVFYSWSDSRGVLRGVDMLVSAAAVGVSERSFGFSCDELKEFLKVAEARIRKEMGLSASEIARKAAAGSGSEWCRVAEDPANDFNFVLRTEGSGHAGRAAEIDRIIAAAKRDWEFSRKKVGTRLEREMKEFLDSRGMVLTPRGIAADYKKLVRRNRTELAPLAEQFKRACGPNKKKLLEAALSFVQGIPYRPRPASEDGKYTAGMAVPLRVLADDSGDCDSKAVLFASLWTALCGHRTILIIVREHMLVGVAAPFASGTTLDLDGIRYVLLEVDCGGSLAPGEVSAYSSEAIARGDMKYRIVS
jgi:hypothetical protein